MQFPTDLELAIIVGCVVGLMLIIAVVGLTVFLMMAKKKRQTRGTYSPSRQVCIFLFFSYVREALAKENGKTLKSEAQNKSQKDHPKMEDSAFKTHVCWCLKWCLV